MDLSHGSNFCGVSESTTRVCFSRTCQLVEAAEASHRERSLVRIAKDPENCRRDEQCLCPICKSLSEPPRSNVEGEGDTLLIWKWWEESWGPSAQRGGSQHTQIKWLRNLPLQLHITLPKSSPGMDTEISQTKAVGLCTLSSVNKEQRDEADMAPALQQLIPRRTWGDLWCKRSRRAPGPASVRIHFSPSLLPLNNPVSEPRGSVSDAHLVPASAPHSPPVVTPLDHATSSFWSRVSNTHRRKTGTT